MTRHVHQPLESCGFEPHRVPPEIAEFVVAPTCVVVGRAVRRRIELVDERAIDQSRERIIERARGQSNLATGARINVRDDRVAVQRLAGERQQDLKDLGRERKVSGGSGG